jgi:uncharacterized protein
MKFLCDQMLGTLAKWLRIYGFDTYFADSLIDDSEIIKLAKKEKRVLITRDKTLVQQARKEKINVISVVSIDINEQIKTVVKTVKFDEALVLSRCILCNSKVTEIKKQDVEEKVPENVFINNDIFWYCKKCDKVYWKGTHYQNMIQKIDDLR